MTIKDKVKLLVAGVAVVAASGLTVLPVSAATNKCFKGGVDSLSADCGTKTTGSDQDLMNVFRTVVNVVLGLVGMIAVVMIIYGGIQYTISAGESGKVKKAKDTIMYGVVGLVVALLAAAIVNFVLAQVFQSA